MKQNNIEELYNKISSYCSYFYATEDNPIDIDITIEGIDEQAQGLAEIYKPNIIGIFQDNEGIVWCNILYEKDYIELHNIIIEDSLKQILKAIEDKL